MFAASVFAMLTSSFKSIQAMPSPSLSPATSRYATPSCHSQFLPSHTSSSKIISSSALLSRQQQFCLIRNSCHQQRDYSVNDKLFFRKNLDEFVPRALQGNADDDDQKQGRWVHFVGIGGYGLSALAMLALKQGWRVSGSDRTWTHRLDTLQEAGVIVYKGHATGNIVNARTGCVPDTIVVSSAIPKGNVEVEAAKLRGVHICKRAAWLCEATKGYELIAVAGTHGKSTTAAMLSFTLQNLGDDLTAVVGADVPQFPGGGNVMVGSGSRFILEADEYDNCFLSIYPSLAIVTNVEWEHVDIFPNKASVQDAFTKFVLQVKPEGIVVLCGDDEGSRSLASNFIDAHALQEAGLRENKALLPQQTKLSKVWMYGLAEGNDWHAEMLAPNVQGGIDYTAVYNGVPMATVSLKSPGIHNVLNSLAVIVVVSVLAIKNKHDADLSSGFNAMKNAAQAASKCLENFVGVQRRFQFLGVAKGCRVYDDYAHHPTEVRAVLQGARQRYGQQHIWVVFQPHTCRRLASMLHNFASAFNDADRVIVAKVYAARVEDHQNFTGANLASLVTG
ncbi:hypothetical protein O6H91_08G019200 [Diphasiastrum complanatum]|nr:hypothetical protein O6H91_08G019200 [Diphasiastrum complanatum]